MCYLSNLEACLVPEFGRRTNGCQQNAHSAPCSSLSEAHTPYHAACSQLHPGPSIGEGDQDRIRNHTVLNFNHTLLSSKSCLCTITNLTLEVSNP